MSIISAYRLSMWRTTAASKPTICRTVYSEIRIVGMIHPKNELWTCASCGENAIRCVL